MDKTLEIMDVENDSIKSGKIYFNFDNVFELKLLVYLYFILSINLLFFFLILELFFLIAKFLKDSQFKNAFDVSYSRLNICVEIIFCKINFKKNQNICLT